MRNVIQYQLEEVNKHTEWSKTGIQRLKTAKKKKKGTSIGRDVKGCIR